MTHYDTLEIPRTATLKDIKSAKNKLSLKHHPDKNPDTIKESTKKIQEINEAFSILSNPILRKEYDSTLPPEPIPRVTEPSESKSSASKPSAVRPKVIRKIPRQGKFEYKGNIVIEGDIEEGAKLKIIDGSLTVKGNIQSDVTIWIFTGVHKKSYRLPGNTERTNFNNCNIFFINNEIFVEEFLQFPTMVHIDGVVMDNVTIKTEDSIVIKNNIGKGCILRSARGRVSTHNVGDNSSIQAKEHITVHYVGNDCSFTSSTRGIKVYETLGDRNTLIAKEDINVFEVGDHCGLDSGTGGVRLLKARSHLKVSARHFIFVDEALGDHGDLSSGFAGVEIKGNIGNSVTISASERIDVNDVGDKCHIISRSRSVTVGNLGSKVTINAAKEITVNGRCPDDAKLHSGINKIKKTLYTYSFSLFAPKLEEKSHENKINNLKFKCIAKMSIEGLTFHRGTFDAYSLASLMYGCGQSTLLDIRACVKVMSGERLNDIDNLTFAALIAYGDRIHAPNQRKSGMRNGF
ncbi:MAG TPA: J domain-containing protein [Gammaproteobacteria bacterium]|jgi:hypothetical protein|nr:J domain-containing protein [Gammaproteobacteria bacterium]